MNHNQLTTNQRLLQIIHKKQTVICLSLDVDNWLEAQPILQACAPYICMVKLHCDLLAEWSESNRCDLIDLAEEHEFLVMQDSKFSDVPKIVFRQLVAHSLWADFVTIQPLNYLDTVDYIRPIGPEFPVTLVCVAEMNTQNSFSKDPRYLAIVKDFVIQNRKLIPAIVSQSAFADIDIGPPGECMRMTPGVCIEPEEAGPWYRTIEDAISMDKNHIVIIGESLINKHKKLMADPATYADNMTALARHSYSCFVSEHGL